MSKNIFLFPLIIGLLSLIGGASMGINEIIFRQSAKTTTGTVLDIEATTSRERLPKGRSYSHSSSQPIVQFTPENSNFPVQFKDNFSNTWIIYKLNETVEVVYNPSNPKQAAIKESYSIWFLVGFLTLFGGIFTTVGTVFFRAAKNMPKDDDEDPKSKQGKPITI